MKNYQPFHGYKGITSLITLYRHGVAVIDKTAEYGSTNYKGVHLEVGHPCPPVCGSIEWSYVK